MCLSTAVCLAVPMFSESQYVNYVKAGRAFERKLEQVETLTCPLIREQWWFGTAHRLSLMLGEVRKNLPVLIPYLQIMTCRMCWITYHDYLRGESSWAFRWKGISTKGYHVKRNRHIDYGNLEYVAMLRFLCLIDEDVAKFLDYLIEYWPSLSVCEGPHFSSKHGVSMKGDIIEIYLAALRGDTLFHHVLQERLDADGLVLPIIYQYFNEFCRLVHFLDACFVTGCMKSTGARVYRLFSSPYFTSDPFVEYWIDGDKALCLHVLLF